jgi:hypothetical protein
MLKPAGMTFVAFAAGELDERDACPIVVNDQLPPERAAPSAVAVTE